MQRNFIYGNYIDEVLLMKAGENDYYYAHDHLYSPAALIDSSGTVLERYEYDAYGNCSILEPNFAPDPDGKSDYGNPYLFTGRRLDILDNSSLKIQYNRNRYYDYYAGRWLTYDPAGVSTQVVFGDKGVQIVGFGLGENDSSLDPHDQMGTSTVPVTGVIQYGDGMNLYEYAHSNPLRYTDHLALWGSDVHLTGTIRWARSPGVDYRYGGCAGIIGIGCNFVDSISSGMAPKPVVGDFRYHFDTDKSGDTVVLDARNERIEFHMRRARDILSPANISYLDVARGLREVGISLHPLQDKYSHSTNHNAATPLKHAPKWWCRWKSKMPLWLLWTKPSHPWYSICVTERGSNDNWNDPHRPDRVSEWLSDYREAMKATKSVLKDVLKYPCVCARCKLGLVW